MFVDPLGLAATSYTTASKIATSSPSTAAQQAAKAGINNSYKTASSIANNKSTNTSAQQAAKAAIPSVTTTAKTSTPAPKSTVNSSNSYIDQWNQMNDQIKKNTTSNSSSGNSSNISNKSSLNADEKIELTIKAAWESTYFSGGVGVGWGRKAKYSGVLELGAVAKWDLIGISFSDGKTNFTSSTELGISAQLWGFDGSIKVAKERPLGLDELFGNGGQYDGYNSGFVVWSQSPEWVDSQHGEMKYSAGVSNYDWVGYSIDAGFNFSAFASKWAQI